MMAEGAKTDRDTSCSTLEPGMSIRPELDTSTVTSLARSLYGLHVTRVTELNSYDDRNFRLQVAAEHTNPHLNNLCPHGYILKVLNKMDTHKNHVAAEHEVQHLLQEAGIACPQPVLNVHGEEWHRVSVPKPSNNNELNNKDVVTEALHLVRLLTFLPGRIFFEVPYTPRLLYRVGQHIGHIENTLKDFSHPALEGFQTVWSLSSLPKLRQFLYAVKDPEYKAIVEDIITTFETEVEPAAKHFPKGVIHGDYNEQNILVVKSPDGAGDDDEIAGVLDFGDVQIACYVYEAAITIMYMMVESKIVPPLLVGGHVLAGYVTRMPLGEAEWAALRTCVAGRYCQSLVMGAYSLLQDPGNEYLVVTAANGWSQMKLLWSTPKEELYAGWRQVMESYQDKCV